MDVDDLRKRTDGFLVDGRPITNEEMWLLREDTLRRREERIARWDCHDCSGPWAEGTCRHGVGRCRFFVEAEKLIWRYEHDGKERNDPA